MKNIIKMPGGVKRVPMAGAARPGGRPKKNSLAAIFPGIIIPPPLKGEGEQFSQATLNCSMILSRSWAQAVNWAAWCAHWCEPAAVFRTSAVIC